MVPFLWGKGIILFNPGRLGAQSETKRTGQTPPASEYLAQAFLHAGRESHAVHRADAGREPDAGRESHARARRDAGGESDAGCESDAGGEPHAGWRRESDAGCEQAGITKWAR